MELSNYGTVLLFGQTFPLLLPVLLPNCVDELQKLSEMMQKITERFERSAAIQKMHLKRAEEIALRAKHVPLGPAEKDEFIHCLAEAYHAGVQLPKPGR